MQVEIFSPEKHYDLVHQWWTEQNWNPIPQMFLSPSGFIIKDESDYVISGWVYDFVDVPMCFLEFIVANPKIRREKRTEAFDLLMKTVEGYCNSMGNKIIFTSVKSESLMCRLEKYNFQRTDIGMTNLIRSL